MNRIVTALVKLAPAAVVSLVVLGTSGCAAEVYGDAAYYPDDSFVATADPVYFDGQANYYYGDRWYYRGSGGRWSSYGSEPSYLRAYRGAHPTVVRGGARGGVRGGARGGARGGGRGGHR
jgi:hypothetical protein